MPQDLGDIGPRLKDQRERRGISQRELARRLGVSASLISQIESGQSRPSVSTLYAIVSELGASLEHVFHGHSHDDGHGAVDGGSGPGGQEVPRSTKGPVVHPGERHVIELASGVRWERLTSGDEHDFDFLYVVYDVGGSSAPNTAMMRHPGREYGYVISGRLGVRLGFEQYELGPGDTVGFDSTRPHRLWNIGDEPVHGIWFVIGRDG